MTSEQLRDRISSGNTILIKVNDSPEKQAAAQAYAAGDFAKAANQFQASLTTNRNDPEALIGLNNARIGNGTSYTIATSVPIGTDPNGALEILRGIAQAQNEINQAGGINGVPVKVTIANDDNNPTTAKQVAEALVKRADVLGVVGPYASDVSLATVPVYQAGELVVISPISTSVKLSGFSRYFFRTVPSDYVAARALANYALTTLRTTKAAVFFNSQSGYSQSLKAEFMTALSLGGGQTVAEFDLADPSLGSAQSLTTALRQGANVLMLATSTSTLDKALQIVQVNQRRLPMLAGDDAYTLKTLEVGGAAAEGMVVSIPWHLAASPSGFVQRSRALWQADVNWRTALSYDATQALIAALQKNPTRSGVQQALSTAGFSTSGASGTVRFLPSGDRDATVQLVKVTASNGARPYDFVPIPR